MSALVVISTLRVKFSVIRVIKINICFLNFLSFQNESTKEEKNIFFFFFLHPVLFIDFSRSCFHVSQALRVLTLLMLNKLRCNAHFKFPANQITWSDFLIEIHIFNDKHADPDQLAFSNWSGSTLFAKSRSCSAREGLINKWTVTSENVSSR